MGQPVGYSLLDLYSSEGFQSTWGRVLAFFSFASFLAILKHVRFFFRFSDLAICGFLVWSDSVRTATAVAIIHRFTAGTTFTAVQQYY